MGERAPVRLLISFRNQPRGQKAASSEHCRIGGRGGIFRGIRYDRKEAAVKPVNATRRGCSAGLRRLAGRLLSPSLVPFLPPLSVAVDLALNRVNLKSLVWTQPAAQIMREVRRASFWLASASA